MNQQILSKPQKATLMNWISHQASVSMLLDKDGIHSLVYDISSVVPGLNWIYQFKKHHLSWTESTTSSFRSSKSKVPQVNPMIRPTRDSEKQGTRAKLSGDLIPRDQSTNQIHFGRARSPLINRWQTVGTVCNQQRHGTPAIG